MKKIFAFLLAGALSGLPARSQSTESAGAGPKPEGYFKSSFNPDLSAILDLNYRTDDTDDGVSHLLGEMAGFGLADGHDGHGHDDGMEKGFNMRHLELQVSADVDPYFKGNAIAGIDPDGAELEVGEVETTCLPYGLKLKAGKFFSDFGYINAQHAHQWDFADQPLIYQLTLGEHGLNDKGVQASWLAPAPFYLLAGVEAFQGDNENMFAYHGDGSFPTHDGPRVGVGWLKVGPNLPGGHGLQFGLSAGTGKHQEEHDGNGDGEHDHGLDGDSTFWGADLVYKYDAPKPLGRGDMIFQAEYFSRRKDLDLLAHDLRPELAGNSRVDEQDGYYAQVVYGFLPRWRAGIRWEQVGLTNDSDLPDGSNESFDASHRAGVMLDFTPSEFSRIRAQVSKGSYATEDGDEDAFDFTLQLVVSIGAHGAHKF